MLQRVDEERWVALFVMAEGVKKYTGTSLRERIVAEIIGRVRGDTRIVARCLRIGRLTKSCRSSSTA